MKQTNRTLPAIMFALGMALLAAAPEAAADGGGGSAPVHAGEQTPPLPAMVLVEAGSFLMGRDDGAHNERPAHAVTISRNLLVAAFMVTQDEYEAFCKATGRPGPKARPEYSGGKKPAIGVDWYDAAAYCNWLSAAHGYTPCYSGAGNATRCDFDADGYRLPTEAEWEWAARGGRLGPGFLYAGSDDPGTVAWFDGNSGGVMRECGLLAPNELGLFDMSGNLYEWCWDFYAADAYATSGALDPTGPSPKALATPRGSERVRRGGSWRENAASASVFFRARDYAGYPGDNGFRLFRSVGPSAP